MATKSGKAVGWEALGQLLRKLTPTGKLGFEGLTARLLELLLDEKFLLARSGDQPGGDSHTPNNAVSLQCKRYTNTAPSENEIEGEIREASRRFPNLDMFVLALTRECPSQLRVRLNEIENETGIDLVVINYSDRDEVPQLAALLVTYYTQLKTAPFQEERAPSPTNLQALFEQYSLLETWVERAASSTEVRASVQNLQRGLKGHIQTWRAQKQRSDAYLKTRFGLCDCGDARYPFRCGCRP